MVQVILAPILPLGKLRPGEFVPCRRSHSGRGAPGREPRGPLCSRALPPSAAVLTAAPAELPRQRLPRWAGVRAGMSYSGSLDPASNHSKCTEKVLPSPSASGLARGLPRSKCRWAAHPPHPSHLLAPQRPRAQARAMPPGARAPLCPLCVLSHLQGKWPGAPFKAVTQRSLLR